MLNETIEHFRDEGLIDTTIRPLKHGKEASVHLCRANRDVTGVELAALKIYHPLNRRDFRDESLYRDGEFIKERRVRTALEKKTRFGRRVQGAIWVYREWETLQRLQATDVPAPRPIAVTDDAILMSYIGDVDTAAPRLREYRPDSERELEGLWGQLRGAVEHMLFHDLIHADLSPYNVLVWEGRVTVIDFPQAVDPRHNSHAEEFLYRDIRRLGEWFDTRGLALHWDRIAGDIWFAWTHADLVPAEYRLGPR